MIHPYDVGDRILLNGSSTIYTVQKRLVSIRKRRSFAFQKPFRINILTTEARDLANHCVYLKNCKLFHEDVLNLGRSLNAVVEIGIVFQTSEITQGLISRRGRAVNCLRSAARCRINAFVEDYINNEREVHVAHSPGSRRFRCTYSYSS